MPGVLASINRVLADHGVNVEGQLLRTRDELGYVITDIGTQYSDEVLDELRAMDVTIRLRTIEWSRALNLSRSTRRPGLWAACSTAATGL